MKGDVIATAPATGFSPEVFGRVANKYSRFRPQYPAALFEYLSSLCTDRRCALDCATGNGQAARGLVNFFSQVVALDASTNQLASRIQNDRLSYVAAHAETLPIRDKSVDLILVAQALHWFNFDRFYENVRRVVVPGGVLAATCYHWTHVSPEVDAVRHHFHQTVVKPYWTPERRHVDEMYKTIPFPFDEVVAPVFTMEMSWTMNDLLGYFE